jgi:microcin C transport system permease protein
VVGAAGAVPADHPVGFVEPDFWWLLGIMALFSWLALVDVVRAEFLRGRNLEYVKAARALGLPTAR